MQIEQNTATQKPPVWAPLALGFRPFFLMGIWFAVLLMSLFLFGFATGTWHYNYFDMPLWHAHEMVFGYAVAIIAGFLLTSVRNWTGLATPSGLPLAFLALLWLAPRLISSTPIPPYMFAMLDILFLPLLALLLGRLILKAKQPRNYPVPVLLLLLALCNTAVHLEVLGLFEHIAHQAIQIAVCLMVAIIALIGGRVVPFFMQRSAGRKPEASQWIEKLALPSVLLVAFTLMTNLTWLIAFAALATAMIHGLRLFSWFDRSILQEPMLWVLHIGYGWLVAGFLIYAVSILLDISTTQAIHAWTLGAIGTFTLGMIARVALGHSGRVIKALPWMKTAFVLISIATLVRVVLPLIEPELFDSAIYFSAICWIAAFIITAIRYSSILLRAREDGKPG